MLFYLYHTHKRNEVIVLSRKKGNVTEMAEDVSMEGRQAWGIKVLQLPCLSLPTCYVSGPGVTSLALRHLQVCLHTCCLGVALGAQKSPDPQAQTHPLSLTLSQKRKGLAPLDGDIPELQSRCQDSKV